MKARRIVAVNLTSNLNPVINKSSSKGREFCNAWGSLNRIKLENLITVKNDNEIIEKTNACLLSRERSRNTVASLQI